MKNASFLIIMTIIFISSINLFAGGFKRDSIQMIDIYCTFWTTLDNQFKTPNQLINEYLISDVYRIKIRNKQFLKEFEMSLNDCQQKLNEYNKLKNLNYRLVAIIHYNKHQDTISFENFFEIMRINEGYFHWNWALFYFLMNKMPLEFKKQIEFILAFQRN